MSWFCDRCEKTNDDDTATRCAHCGKPNALFAPDRGDWTCPECGAENGGGYQRCARCNARKP
jgi:hypothetical protein